MEVQDRWRSLYKQNSRSPPLCRGFVIVQRYKEKCCRICANTTSIPSISAALTLQIRGHLRPAHLASRSLPSSSIQIAQISVLSPFLHSMVSTSISPITNKLESANHLADCEKTQALCRNNTTGYHLLGAEIVSDLLKCIGWWCSGLLCLVEEGAGVSCALDESLEV